MQKQEQPRRGRSGARVRAARRALPTPENHPILASLATVLCEPTRLRIILALSPGPLSVGELAEVLGRSESATSQHLRVLRDHGVVTARRRGRVINYTLSDIPIARTAQAVIGAVCQPPLASA